MIREIDENLIRPEKLLRASDMAKLGCGGCSGCAVCCERMGTMIVLDPWDVRQLTSALHMSFEELLMERAVTLAPVDGIILPGLASKPGTDSCFFLSDEGRCRIHRIRPGICRLFPLARLWHEDGSFSYFLQEGECPKADGTKIKLDKWLGIPDLKAYEEEAKTYHAALTALKKACANARDEDTLRRLQTDFLIEHFLRL